MTLRINIIGGLEVFRNEKPVALPQSKKTRALLAFLVLSDRPQRRDHLCEMFWDVPDDPRGALRWSLSKLRRILNTADRTRLEADRQTVFVHKDDLTVDLREVGKLRPADVAAAETDVLEKSAVMSGGRLLDDLTLPNCPVYEAWRVAHVNEYELLQLTVLQELLDRTRHDPARALPFAQTLQRLDPDDSEVSKLVDKLAEAVREKMLHPGGEASESEEPSEPKPEWKPVIPAVRVAHDNELKQTISFCRARDGAKIAYAISGEGPPILRAPHWMTHLEYELESPVWRHWIRALSAQNTLVRFDYRCNGLSERGVDDVSIEAKLSDMEAVVDAVGLDRFVIFGMSQGGALAVEYTARHPERTAGLVMCGSYTMGWRARNDPEEIARREAMETLILTGWGRNEPAYRQIFTSLFLPEATPAQRDWYNDLQARTVTPEDAYRLSRSVSRLDVTDKLPKVTAPALVMHARGDLVAPYEYGKAFAELMPNARFVELDSNNHILIEDEPAFERFVTELRRFMTDDVMVRRLSPPEPQRERRQVSALVIELASPLFEFDDLDAEVGAETTSPVLQDLCETIEAFGGLCVFRGETDVTAVFGAGHASEEHAFQACRAALEARAHVAAISDNAVGMRAAIDTGDAVVTRNTGSDGPALTISGSPIRVARQIARALNRDAIAASARACSAAGGYVTVSEMDRGIMPGLPDDWKISELLGESAGLSRWNLRLAPALSPFVGRELELKLMEQVYRRAADGFGRTVAIIADPGIGKSRLAHEFLSSDCVAGARLIECGALEIDTSVSLLLAKKLLMAVCGIDQGSGSEQAAAALASWISKKPELEELSAPLRFLLDLEIDDPAWKALSSTRQLDRVATALATMIEQESLDRPVVLLIEDLHWLDEASEAVLKRVINALPSRPVLSICTYRPAYKPSWTHPDTFDQIALAPLSETESETILRDLLGDDPSLTRAVSVLVEKTDGVPLYIEETVRALAGAGQLAGEAGSYVLTDELEEIRLPTSVQSLLEANLQNLDPDSRTIMQMAAAIGRQVPFDLLEQISGLPSEKLIRKVDELCSNGLLVRTRLHPVGEYRIKHALLQQAAYATLTRRNRQAIHVGILELVEGQAATAPLDQSETLARHALLGEKWEKAAEYFLPSARRALERSAHSIALSHVRDGIKALSNIPETEETKRLEISYREVEGVAWMLAKGWSAEEVSEAYDRAAELSEELGDSTERFAIMRGKAQYFMISGRPKEAQDIACACSKIVEQTAADDAAMQIETSHMFWTNSFFLADYETVMDHTGRAAAIYRPDDHHSLTYQYSGHDPGVCCRVFRSLTRELSAAPKDADKSYREASELAERFDHPLTSALVCWGESLRSMFRSDAKSALRSADEEVSICETHMLPLLRSQGIFTRGWALFNLGNKTGGLRTMEDGLEGIRRSGAQMGLPYLLSLYAEALVQNGAIDEAAATLESALSQVKRSGSRFQLSEIVRIKAGVTRLLGAGDDGVENHLREAVSIAQKQRARLSELRAATSLGQFLRDARRGSEATELMNAYLPIIEDLADLPVAAEAKSLI